MQPGWCQSVRQEFVENECEALPGVAYPGVRDNRSTRNTKTGYDDNMMMVVIFCHIYHPHPHGITVVSVPITMVLLLTLSPSPWYYRNFRPRYRGFTAVPVPMQLSSLLLRGGSGGRKGGGCPVFSLSRPINPNPCTCWMMLRCFWQESKF